MQDYFHYFTEIEDRYCQRRGTIGLLSTLDWALIETWKDGGIPLEAVLRGIDATFDRYDARPSKTRKINSLAYCAQEVLAAAEEMQEAALGSTRSAEPEPGFDPAQIAAYLDGNAAKLESLMTKASSQSGAALPDGVRALVSDTARSLHDLAAGARDTRTASLEDLERRLTVMEEKLFAALLANTADDLLVAVRADADRELAPYRRKMSGPQIDQLQKQYIHKRLLERFGVPRLSLFYM